MHVAATSFTFTPLFTHKTNQTAPQETADFNKRTQSCYKLLLIKIQFWNSESKLWMLKKKCVLFSRKKHFLQANQVDNSWKSLGSFVRLLTAGQCCGQCWGQCSAAALAEEKKQKMWDVIMSDANLENSSSEDFRRWEQFGKWRWGWAHSYLSAFKLTVRQTATLFLIKSWQTLKH